ncbi:MAG: hypothetical protein R3F11_11575 [Verrucomicrobiales bacterium]
MHGFKVLMLEAGRNYSPEKETPMFQTPEMAPLRGAATPDKPFGFFDATVDGGWRVPGEPYTSAEGVDFMWWRSRMLGDAPTTGGASRCGWANTTSSRAAGTGWASTYRWITKTSRPTTTRSRR